MPPPARLLGWAGAAVSGALAGLTGGLVHAVSTRGVPVGLALALVLTGFTYLAVAAASRDRRALVAAVAGWCLPTFLFSAPRPEGDLIIAGNPVGYAWLGSGVVLTCVALVLPFAAPSAAPPERR